MHCDEFDSPIFIFRQPFWTKPVISVCQGNNNCLIDVFHTANVFLKQSYYIPYVYVYIRSQYFSVVVLYCSILYLFFVLYSVHQHDRLDYYFSRLHFFISIPFLSKYAVLLLINFWSCTVILVLKFISSHSFCWRVDWLANITKIIQIDKWRIRNVTWPSQYDLILRGRALKIKQFPKCCVLVYNSRYEFKWWFREKQPFCKWNRG